MGSTSTVLRIKENEMIENQPAVKLLGIYTDKFFKFDHHVCYVCSRSSNEVNALDRLVKLAKCNWLKHLLCDTSDTVPLRGIFVIWIM